MEFIIITGLSGAGKSVAMRSMEDIGYYCVDNIPPVLLTTFYDLCEKSSDERMKKMAIVTDVRSGEVFTDLFASLDRFRSEGKRCKILFLDAQNAVLLRRYKETRRKHPLIDVSKQQLRERISSLFLGNAALGMTVTCLSFGFKYGIPSEADLVFDVRCLPNPFYVPELKQHTGLEACVFDYVMQFEQSKGYAERILSLVDYSLPLYLKEGKSQLVIASGCTGGKHRSVTMTRILYQHILESGQKVIVHHRDIGKE